MSSENHLRWTDVTEQIYALKKKSEQQGFDRIDTVPPSWKEDLITLAKSSNGILVVNYENIVLRDWGMWPTNKRASEILEKYFTNPDAEKNGLWLQCNNSRHIVLHFNAQGEFEFVNESKYTFKTSVVLVRRFMENLFKRNQNIIKKEKLDQLHFKGIHAAVQEALKDKECIFNVYCDKKKIEIRIYEINGTAIVTIPKERLKENLVFIGSLVDSLKNVQDCKLEFVFRR